MQRIKIALLFFIIFGSSCERDLASLNEDPKNPAAVTSASLFTNAERSFARTIASSNVNLNIFRLIVQYWQETTYTAESRYNLNSRNIPSNFWQALYRDVLRDLQEARTRIPTELKDPDPQRDAAIKKNQIAIIDILQVYTYYYLVTTYGDIPYGEALNIENVFPQYENQRTVFNDLLRRLDEDIANLDATVDQTGMGTADVIYGNDANANNVEQWERFANSMKLKLGMTIADADPTRARTAVESAVAAGVFQSNADIAEFDFLGFPPNTNPIWEDLVQSGRKDFVAASTIIDTMETFDDPRLPLYFTVDQDGGYSGGSPGRSSSYSIFSKPSDQVIRPTFPGILLDYSEVEFFLAEAKERGWNVPGTAQEHYNAGITASILYWGGLPQAATAYLAQPEVAYNSAASDWRQKIGIQKWIALYNRGIDAWIEQRRLDFPRLQPAFGALSGFPVRFTYPVNEQNYNTANYNKAAASIGGDDVETPLFWDVN
jgi:hypothetical protein